MLFNRRRTYLNYLFENMTFLTIIRMKTSYPSDTITITGNATDDKYLSQNFTATLYSGNLSQYHKFLIFPLIYKNGSIVSSNNDRYIHSHIIDTGGYIMLSRTVHINYVSDCSGTGSTGSKPYFNIVTSDQYINLGISSHSITLSSNIGGNLRFNGNTNVKLNILFNTTDASDYAIFGINE